MQILKRLFLGILAVSIATAAMAADSVRLHGTLVIESNKYTTKFIVRSGDDSGPADHVFRVWSNPGLSLEGGYRGASVEYYGASLIVVLPTTKSVLTFAVDGSTPALPRPEGFQETSYGVAGINHETGGGAARHQVKTTGVVPMNACEGGCDEAGFEVPDPWNWEAGGAACNSGGPGSNACSQQSAGGTCSVSCNAGYYACCTVAAFTSPKCFCVRN